MSEDAIVHSTTSHVKRLAIVSPGTKCRLVEIEGAAGSRHNHRHGKGRMRRHGHQGRDPDCPFRHFQREPKRGLMRRLMDLGLTKGCVFTIIQGGGKGPVLIEIRGTRIALGHHMACQILVEEVS
ncbi:MAG: ferrous iron transport protein A [Candidatus Hodarchaeota archaeon]